MHYGIFCAVHVALFWTFASGIGMEPDPMQLPVLLARQFSESPFMLTKFVLIVAFHSYLFIWFWLLPGRWKHDKPDEIMASPYGRIIVIHVTIVLGGFVTVSLGKPLSMLIFLALLKTAMELGAIVASTPKGQARGLESA